MLKNDVVMEGAGEQTAASGVGAGGGEGAALLAQTEAARGLNSYSRGGSSRTETVTIMNTGSATAGNSSSSSSSNPASATTREVEVQLLIQPTQQPQQQQEKEKEHHHRHHHQQQQQQLVLLQQRLQRIRLVCEPLLPLGLCRQLVRLSLDWCKCDVLTLQLPLVSAMQSCSSLEHLSLVGYQGDVEEVRGRGGGRFYSEGLARVKL
jgi:hypothetical protein